MTKPFRLTYVAKGGGGEGGGTSPENFNHSLLDLMLIIDL